MNFSASLSGTTDSLVRVLAIGGRASLVAILDGGQANDKRGAGYHHGPRPLNNLPSKGGVGSCAETINGNARLPERRRDQTKDTQGVSRTAKSSPRISIANALGGSVVPTNARPKSVSNMGSSPCRVKP